MFVSVEIKDVIILLKEIKKKNTKVKITNIYQIMPKKLFQAWCCVTSQFVLKMIYLSLRRLQFLAQGLKANNGGGLQLYTE